MLTEIIHTALTKPYIARFVGNYLIIRNFMDKYLTQFLLFFFRFWMARIFWYSGLTKISSWQSTISLFQTEYKVPFIPPELAAYISTSVELICPILLILGIATRLSTLPMLAMTAVIEFTYFDSIEHYYWAMILGTIALIGPGKISLDYFISKKLGPKHPIFHK